MDDKSQIQSTEPGSTTTKFGVSDRVSSSLQKSEEARYGQHVPNTLLSAVMVWFIWSNYLPLELLTVHMLKDRTNTI